MILVAARRGSFGMLIVEDAGDDIPDDVYGMNERLAVGFLEPDVVAGNGGDTLTSGSLTTAWTVNGEVKGSLFTPVNVCQQPSFRFVSGQAAGIMAPGCLHAKYPR